MNVRPVRIARYRRQPWSTWVFTLLLVVMVTTAWPTVLDRLHPVSAHWRIHWWLLAVVFTAAYMAVLRFEFCGEMQEVTLSEVPLLIGLVFARPDQLLLATVVGGAIAVLWFRPPPVKAVFNIAVASMETVVAAVSFHAVLGHSGAISPMGWLAALVAIAAANAASTVCVQVVIALSVGRFDRSGLGALGAVLSGVAILNVAVGMVTVVLVWQERIAVLPALGIAIVLGVGYRSHSQMRRRHADLEEIYRFSRTLAGLNDAEEVIAAVLSEARTRLRAEVAELALDGAEGTVCFTLRGDGPLRRTTTPAHHSLRCVGTGVAGGVVPRGTKDDQLSDALAACGYRDAVAAPLPAVNSLAGTLIVADRLSDPVTFDDADLELLQVLANHTAMSLHAAQLLDWLRQEVADKNHLAMHDPLTDLANRSLFNEKVEALLAQRRGTSVVAVMLMDLNRFKEVNDTLGHQSGDEVLQQIAQQLVRAVRPGSVGRLGGDEFAVVVAVESHADLGPIVRDVAAAGRATICGEGICLNVGSSLGVAIAPDHGHDRSTLLRAADVAMYQAKANEGGAAIYDPERDDRPRLTAADGRAPSENGHRA